MEWMRPAGDRSRCDDRPFDDSLADDDHSLLSLRDPFLIYALLPHPTLLLTIEAPIRGKATPLILAVVSCVSALVLGERVRHN